MSETRELIADHVRAHPGVHFSGIVRALDLAPGQVQYHLRRLRRADRVTEEGLYGRTHYYPPGFDPWERRALALLRRETAGDIVARLVAGGSARPADVAADLDLARSTLSWHVDRLEASGLVERRRDDHGGVTLAAADPERTAALLTEVDPSLPERLVSRFARLVDNLLEDATSGERSTASDPF